MYLPHPPRNFRDIVHADLLRAERLILRIQDELDPQFRIATPERDWWIGITLSDDVAEREQQFALVSDFMALKSSPAFTLATELKEPDAVCCVGVSHSATYGAAARIHRKPITFGPIEWLTDEQIGNDVHNLLPRGVRSLSSKRLVELEDMFGERGMFPAVKIETREIGV